MRKAFLLWIPALAACLSVASQCNGEGSVAALDASRDSISDPQAERGDVGADGKAGSCTPTPVLDPVVVIPGGSFLVGSPETEFGRGPFDQDQVTVTLTHSFELGRTELTQREWTSFCAHNPSGKDEEGTEDCLQPECPVGGVTWFDAVAWLNGLSKSRGLPECYRLNDCTGTLGMKMSCKTVDVLATPIYECGGYRLPTEFEFEYAARASTTTAFYSGDITPVPGDPDTCIFDANLDSIGWYCKNSGLITHPVAKKSPNAWGLYDMSGNAAEWTHSRYTASGYGKGPLVDPPGTLSTVYYGDSVTLRGGIYNYSSRSARSAYRLEASNWGRGAGGGFRVARTRFDSDAGADEAGANDANAD